ncbi:MAG: hypothetical protein IPL53_07310 [Ignavibacteria bacterium]|nr:hypothetical protein [Ignavibacteria bacterium]
MTKLELVIEKLGEIPQMELDKVDNLLDEIMSRNKKPKHKLKFDWKGALKDENLSSVELQHQILNDWSKLD